MKIVYRHITSSHVCSFRNDAATNDLTSLIMINSPDSMENNFVYFPILRIVLDLIKSITLYTTFVSN